MDDCRAFLDANILFSAAYQHGAGLQALWRLQGVELCTSRYAIEEAQRNLDGQDQIDRLRELVEGLKVYAAIELPTTPKRPAYGLPPSDQLIIWAAIDVEATHLITGDLAHFGHLYNKCVDGVMTIRVADFLKLCTERDLVKARLEQEEH